MEGVTANKRKMKELEDNLLYKLTSTKVNINFFKIIVILSGFKLVHVVAGVADCC